MITPEEAAQLILDRREARKSILAFARFLKIEPEPAEHHVLLLDKYLQRVIDGEIDRLMVFMPPGCAKSTYCTVMMPSFYLGNNPDHRVITASYDSDLATDFAGKVRNLFSQNTNYRQLFPNMALSADTKAKGHWNINDKKGGLYATGVGSAVTGRRANLAILDDLVKGRKEADSPREMQNTWRWFTADLSTRLLPNAKIVYITTRWSQNDPAGRLLPEDWNGESGPIECNDGKTWEVLCLPAQAMLNDPLGREVGDWLWPDFYTPQFWEDTKRLQLMEDTRNWNSLYQQVPAPEEGIDFKREWFKWYDEPPALMNYYIAADFAVTENQGDFTEIGVFGVDQDGDIYVAPKNGWWTGKSTSYVWVDRLLDLVRDFQPHMFISEKGVIRNAVEPWLDGRVSERAKEGERVHVAREWLPHIGNKTANSRSFHGRAAQGKIHLPKNATGERIFSQLLEFPAGKHDDIVDCCGLIGRYLQMSVAPKLELVQERKRDRWDRAFDRLDHKADSWKTA